MPLTRSLALIITAALAAGALSAGCDTVQPEPSLTKDQAVERVEARAQEAFRQLPAGATLKPRSTEPAVPCDEGPGGRTFVENDYTIDYPSGWPVAQTIPALADYWAANGYRTVKDDRTRDKTPALGAEHPDGFRVGIRLTYRDTGAVDAILTSSSPCL